MSYVCFTLLLSVELGGLILRLYSEIEVHASGV